MTRRNDRVGKGIAIAVASSTAAAAIYFVLALVLQQIIPNAITNPTPLFKAVNNTLTLLFWGIGFSQIIHILPIALWLKRRQEIETLKGLIIGAAIVCLLCGGCFVVFSQTVTSYFLLR